MRQWGAPVRQWAAPVCQWAVGGPAAADRDRDRDLSLSQQDAHGAVVCKMQSLEPECLRVVQ